MKKTQFFALIFSFITAVILSPSVANAEKIQLTPSQQKQILEIQKDATTKLKAILTPAQRAQAEAAVKNGEKKVDLKLTEDQKVKIKKLSEEANKKVNAVLKSK
jgi:Spy/CpxP family protein refolding chaperone